MPAADHCILVHLSSPVDQSAGFTPKSLEAYKDSLHHYVWDALEPLNVEGGLRVVHDRHVFSVDDPDGGEHHTDVILGGLDRAVFCRLLRWWSQQPIEGALKCAAKVPPKVAGYREDDVEKVWLDSHRVDKSLTPASLAAREKAAHDSNSHTASAWSYDAWRAHKLAEGMYDVASGFFSLHHGTSKLFEQQIVQVEASASDFALVFVSVEST